MTDNSVPRKLAPKGLYAVPGGLCHVNVPVLVNVNVPENAALLFRCVGVHVYVDKHVYVGALLLS
jgi:hypothetical protein